jgi:hypothetical protein
VSAAHTKNRFGNAYDFYDLAAPLNRVQHESWWLSSVVVEIQTNPPGNAQHSLPVRSFIFHPLYIHPPIDDVISFRKTAAHPPGPGFPGKHRRNES